MAKRKTISKRVRFEVLKRDSFTCQYCGKMPPDTVLNIDHIKPVSKGGNNGMLNLVTSCVDCNLGKSNIELSDDSAIKKQQAQLSYMAEKKAQIEMMISWKESLHNAESLLVDSCVDRIDSLMPGYSLNELGILKVKKAVMKHGYDKVLNQIDEAYQRCNSVDDVCEKILNSLPHIGKVQDESEKSKNYIKGILRNRFGYFNEKSYYVNMAKCELDKQDYDLLVSYAKSCKNPSSFYEYVEELIDG